MTVVENLASFIVGLIKLQSYLFTMERLKKYVSEIKNFPRKGVVFKDINPIYKNPKLMREIMLPLENLISTTKPDYIAGIEARGFISASALAYKLEIGFISIRKPNKLPGKVKTINYQLEYGEDTLEIQKNLIKSNSKIILIDDLLATGGTASAAGELINGIGGILIGYGFLIEITTLNGRKNLDSDLIIESVIKY